MLQIKNFKKYYQQHLILDIPSLHIPHGIHWIVGANGSGKTTFFRSIGGILPFDGELELYAVNQKKSPLAYRSLVSYGEAEPQYPRYLSANDLINFVATVRQADKKQVQMLIQSLGISEFLHQPTGGYSSGMLKKVSLAMAFVGQPKLIILDEPLITIDQKAMAIIGSLVKQCHYKQSIDFLISSHQHFDDSDIIISKTYEVKHSTLQELA